MERNKDFFEQTGPMAVGSRLRMLTDRITTEASAIYDLYGVALRPKWFPVCYLLAHDGAATVTEIARRIGHSHPSVSTIVKEMKAAGLADERRDPADGRKGVVALTDEGVRLAERLEEQCADVAAAIDGIARQSRHDLWQALGEWERLLAEESLLQRVKAVRRMRARDRIRIVPYAPCYAEAFRTLNEEWITAHWQIEEADRKVLDHPQEEIIDRGGEILVALCDGRPVGVCALLRMEDPRYDFELAKYAVSPAAQGLGIGYLLAATAVEHAKAAGAGRLFLESNRLLQPAIRIYGKLGFTELAEQHPAYARGDIQMELIIA